jgi:hypothetical protein
MNIDNQNTLFKLAFEFVNDTKCHVYLTGKAGTGKTTFLKYVKQHCTKKLIVVAPTGVAAINAGGVTMHSFFQLPFIPYIASMPNGFGMNENVANRNTLLKNLRLTNVKRNIIQELELLIIDEVSMLRADMLDAIDTILRSVRKNNKPFGGVQLLFIGDLYQLPPVVVNSEKEIIDAHYQSPFFFHAKVFEETSPLYIELKTIYRQSEQHFIDLLNHIRNNQLTREDYDELEKRYQPLFYDKEKKYITLTSHNHKADSINREELDRLKTPLYEFKGEIKNDFGDKQLPTDLTLRLKAGAQVMFIKNDVGTEKRYYNGKIVLIEQISADKIVVKFPDSGDTMEVQKETWDNVSYSINTETGEIEEKLLGQFIQYPLRLAWAITIHKSQGLTFEHAILDAGESFAPGQVYVALSRCTSLDGVILHSRITPRSLHSDYRVFDFTLKEYSEAELNSLLNEQRYHYQTERLTQLFHWHKIQDAAYTFLQHTLSTRSLPNPSEAETLCKDLIEKIKQQKEVADKFQVQLQSLFNEVALSHQSENLRERTRKAIGYFIEHLHDNVVVPLQEFQLSLATASKMKKYHSAITEFMEVLWMRIYDLQKASFDHYLLSEGLTLYSHKKIENPKAAKKAKGDSAKETLAYFMAGKTIAEIAALRKLATSTIEGHLVPFVKSGDLDIFRFLSLEDLEKIHQCTLDNPALTGKKEVKDLLNNEYSYAQIDLAFFYFELEP